MFNKKSVSEIIHKDPDRVIMPFTLIFITITLSILNPGVFLSSNNFTAIAFQIPELGLFSLAMMISMITGGINLSIISTANLSGVIMALMMTRLIPEDTGSATSLALILGIILIGLMVSLILGAFNGILIAYVELSPVLATIGTMILYEGITLSITKGYVVSGCPDAFVSLGNSLFLGIPIPLYIFTAAVMVLHQIIKGKPFGRYLFLIGSNIKAVEYSGINVRKVLVKTYMLSSLYAGIASVIMLARLNSANARYGASYMLLAVLISVLGGTDPNGGFGKVSGLVDSAYLITVSFQWTKPYGGKFIYHRSTMGNTVVTGNTIQKDSVTAKNTLVVKESASC